MRIPKIPSRRREITDFKLDSLLEITLAINENLPTSELLSKYEDILKGKTLLIGKVIIFKHNIVWECILNSDFNPELENIDVEKLLTPIREITFRSEIPYYISEEIEIVIPVFHKDVPIAYVLIGDIEEEGEGMSPVIKHRKFIQTISNIMIVAIENQRLNVENLRQVALKRELELASKMQNMLIPNSSKLPSNQYLNFTAFYHPHYDVGGDYYDVVKLSDEEIGFCIADVSGKGISAAILMSNFQANLRALFTLHLSLEELMERLNERVLESAMGEKFITIFIAKYNYRTRVLDYINAGHNPAMLYDMTECKLHLLSNGCVGMGMLDELPFISKYSLTINNPSKLLCYTDGLVELIEGEDVDADYKYLEQEISNSLPIAGNIEQMIIHQGILEGNTAIFDDISILGIEFL
jgi:phosphoserine phosphatase RsbU/P